MSTRMKMLKKALPHSSTEVLKRSASACELQDHDKAYLMMTLDAEVGAADTVKKYELDDQVSDLLKHVVAVQKESARARLLESRAAMALQPQE